MGCAVAFENVKFQWPGASAPLLDAFSLHLQDGTATALVGASGCGKSTLLRLAASLLQPTSGAVRTEGAQPARRAFAFQAPNLLPWRTLAQNVGLPLELSGAPPNASERVHEALAQVGLSDAHALYPHQLSGGMQMRASLARCLVTRPDVLLLDEPFGALDALTRKDAWMVFQDAWTTAGATVLLVTHDIDEAVLLCDRVVVLGGRPLEVRADISVPFARPRPPSLRHDPAFGALVASLESAL